MCDGLPDTSGEPARQGTAEHQAAGECLEMNIDPWGYIGDRMVFLNEREEMWEDDLPESRRGEIQHVIELDDEAIHRVERYVNFVRELVKLTGGYLLVEKRVTVGHITGEGYWDLNGLEVDAGTPGAVYRPAGGTADTIILHGDELIVADYKSGQNRVDAYDIIKPEGLNIITGEYEPPVCVPNKQLLMYAAGALHDFGWMGDFKRIRVIVVQPRLDSTPEFSMTVEEMQPFIEELRRAAEETRVNPTFRPGINTCTFCKARNHCKAREEAVLTTVLDGFQSNDLTSLVQAKPRPPQREWLGALYDKLDMIQQWCKDVHAMVYNALLSGESVVNSQGVAFKLVEGRAGNRYWKDPAKIAQKLVEMGVPTERAYKPLEVISPADAEKLSKKKRGKKGAPGEPALLSPAQWDALQEMIGQDAGKPSISLASDPKPAIDPTTEGFSDSSVSQPPVDSDLFS